VEVLATLQMLWRRRLLVGLGVLAAAAIFLAIEAGKTREVSVARTGVVLDTPSSQLTHVAPRGADSLGWRAGLLADLMTSPEARDRIARDAGVDPRLLRITDPALANPPVAASLPRSAAGAAAVTPEPYEVAVRFDRLVPVIAIEAAAPERSTAIRLAEAAASELKAGAPAPDAAGRWPFVVEDVGPVRIREIGGGSRTAVALAIGAFVFAMWCAAIALASALAGAWRRVARREPALG
jgi:hypothetical protein